MTYRDRRLAKAERLRGWAGGREAKSEAAFDAVHRIADNIPLGQPILVGHHSERRARRDAERIRNGMQAGIENGRKAEEMRSRADNIEHAAEHAIYSDDPHAIERLRARIEELEAQRDQRKAANVAYRLAHKAELRAMTPYERSQAVPYPSYSLTNLSGNIGRQRARLHALEHPRPTTFRARYRDPETCSQCGSPKAEHTPHAQVASVLMCPAGAPA